MRDLIGKLEESITTKVRSHDAEAALKRFRPKLPNGVTVESVSLDFKMGRGAYWQVYVTLDMKPKELWQDDANYKKTADAIHKALESVLGKGLEWYDGSEDWMRWDWTP
jgi:hypothetical protein